MNFNANFKIPLIKNLPPKSMFEIHYSGPKNKGFRQCPFEFCQARFTILKDLKVNLVLILESFVIGP